MSAHVTKRGELFHPEGFPSAVEQLKKHYIHVDIEHDPRKPPVGRVADARIVTLEDGVRAIEGTVEIFEEDDKPDYVPGGKSLIVHELPSEHLQIQYDENYRDSESQKVLTNLADALNAGSPKYFSKNALDALTILTISGSFALGGIASGFLNQLGSDLYRNLKEGLLRLIKEKGKRHKDNLLSFDFNITHGEKVVLVRILCCNPSETDIDELFHDIIPSLDKIVTLYFEGSQPIARLVFEKKESSFQLLYGVRRDGFPLIPVKPVIMEKGNQTNQ